jgi:hypothetical protein
MLSIVVDYMTDQKHNRSLRVAVQGPDFIDFMAHSLYRTQMTDQTSGLGQISHVLVTSLHVETLT